MKKVVIIHRIIAPYRVPFYERLKVSLEQRGINLTVVYGQPARNEKEPYAELGCGIKVKTTYIHICNRLLVWLPALKHAREANIVIVQQANKNLINFLLIPLRKILRYKLAFWGHGRNLQAKKNSLSECLKRIYSTHADHWFAYNDLSAAIVRDLGYPGEKITSANNSIDTNENKLIYDQISDSELDELRGKYHISPDSSVGVFCSRLYKEKRLDFLINCVEKIRNHVDNFHYFVIGDGVEAPIVKSFSEKNGKWFHWVGPKYGREKIEIFKLADFQLMPDGVGLHIVDSFSLLTPLITTESSHHGPEIVYLENGINGLMTKNTVEAYIKATLCIINDKFLREKLVEGCVKAREKYTIENMVKRFTNGICHALST